MATVDEKEALEKIFGLVGTTLEEALLLLDVYTKPSADPAGKPSGGGNTDKSGAGAVKEHLRDGGAHSLRHHEVHARDAAAFANVSSSWSLASSLRPSMPYLST